MKALRSIPTPEGLYFPVIRSVRQVRPVRLVRQVGLFRLSLDRGFDSLHYISYIIIRDVWPRRKTETNSK